MKNKKIESYLEFSVILDMSKYISENNKTENVINNNNFFLIIVIIHSGNCDSFIIH